jgi:hypothetical protein
VFINSKAPVITIRNVANNKHVNSVDLEVQENSIEFLMGGAVHCKGTNMEVVSGRAAFGPMAMGGFDNVVWGGVLHHDDLPVAEYDNDKIVEASGDENPFVVPLNKIKNGNPAVRVDALAELEKARQAFNGSDVDFYKQDQEIVLQRPLSVYGSCAKENNPNKVSGGFETKMGTIKIKYEGDPAVNGKAQLSAALGGNNGVPNQMQAGDQLLKITSMSFQPNMPNHVGKCPATKTIRVNYMGQGEGEIKIRVNDGSETIYQSEKIAYDGGQDHHDFEIDIPNVSKFDLNKTFNKDLKVYVLGKDDEQNIWPTAYQLKDQEDWSYRCTPQLNPNLGGMNGGIGGFQNQGQQQGAPKMQINPQTLNPKPARATNN